MEEQLRALRAIASALCADAGPGHDATDGTVTSPPRSEENELIHEMI
jgi:hypothetical protein